jgi:F-type H+-transporting ATPase subunit a
MGAEEPKPFLEFVLHHLPAALKPWVDIGVVYSVVAFAFLVIVAVLATRRMEQRAEKASKLQMAVEWLYESFEGFIVDVMGPRGKEFVPLLGTFFFYILTMNLIGMIPGFAAPTSRLGMTAALGVAAFCFVQYYGFRQHGIRYLKHFVGEPLWLAPLMLPIHIIGELARPLSLSLRLFGNIFGDDRSVMQFLLLGALVTSYVYVPVPLQVIMLGFALLFGLIQSVVFTLLTAAYISLAIAEEH